MSIRGPILLVHGFFHGAWSWGDVPLELAARGVASVAVDMPGHGLQAQRPVSSTARPFDPEAISSEPSPIKDVDLEVAATALIEQVRRVGRGSAVTVVAHSMSGPVLTLAAEREPGLFAHLVYLAAYMPASDTPCIAYLETPEAEGQRFTELLVADPMAVGALRIDPDDDTGRDAARTAFYGDVPPETAQAAIALLGTDAPTAMAVGTTTLTGGGWGSVPRSYLLCRQDQTVPPALQRLFISQADAAFPDTKTRVIELDSSHSPFLSMPGELADVLAELV
jgi:pimeloyl-ACP methyl ester carboxylesterase